MQAEALPGSTWAEIAFRVFIVNEPGGFLAHFLGLESALSDERFSAYLESCAADREKALSLYALNTRVSAALYGPLQALEVTMRNAFHAQLCAAYGDWWFNEGGLITTIFQRQKLADAQVGLVIDKKAVTPGRVIASLMFGFWTGCLTEPYDDRLWRRGGLSKAFMAGGEKPKRQKVNAMLTPLRKLRNRVAHHEPILYFDLPKHHRNIMTLTSWLSPVAAEWAEAESSFVGVYDEELARHMLKPAQRAHLNSN